MPYIQARLSIETTDSQKKLLQEKLTQATANAFSKPKSFVMCEILHAKSLFMGGQKVEAGAYISIGLLGEASKAQCQGLTRNICDILKNEYSFDSSKVYVTYHPCELWGWNGSMF